MAQLQTPMPILTPPSWASDLLIASLFGRPFPWIDLSLLLSATIAATAISRWTTNALYDDGRAKAQEARVARMAGSPALDKLIALWTLPLPSKAKAIVAKDVKTFVRDPSQWTQLFLVGSIVIIAIVSVANLPVDSFRGPWMQTWLNGLSFLILALVGFVMAALAARFQFAAVSNEGRGFWVMRTGPIGAKEFLWAKAYPGILPMILVGETLAVSSITILDAESAMLWLNWYGSGSLLDFLVLQSEWVRFTPTLNQQCSLHWRQARGYYMLTALGLVFAVLLWKPFPFTGSSPHRLQSSITDTQWALVVCMHAPRTWTLYVCDLYPINTVLGNRGREHCPMVLNQYQVFFRIIVLSLCVSCRGKLPSDSLTKTSYYEANRDDTCSRKPIKALMASRRELGLLLNNIFRMPIVRDPHPRLYIATQVQQASKSLDDTTEDQ